MVNAAACASKASLLAGLFFTHQGRCVPAICPGLIVHKRNEITDPVAKAAKENEYPVGRYGGADDIGHAVRFLCSVRSLSARTTQPPPRGLSPGIRSAPLAT